MRGGAAAATHSRVIAESLPLIRPFGAPSPLRGRPSNSVPRHADDILDLFQAGHNAVEMLGVGDAHRHAHPGAPLLGGARHQRVDGHAHIAQRQRHIRHKVRAVHTDDIERCLIAFAGLVIPVGADPAVDILGVAHALAGVGTVLFVDGDTEAAGDKADDLIAGQR